jgi:hypothetical protein
MHALFGALVVRNVRIRRKSSRSQARVPRARCCLSCGATARCWLPAEPGEFSDDDSGEPAGPPEVPAGRNTGNAWLGERRCELFEARRDRRGHAVVCGGYGDRFAALTSTGRALPRRSEGSNSGSAAAR